MSPLADMHEQTNTTTPSAHGISRRLVAALTAV